MKLFGNSSKPPKKSPSKKDEAVSSGFGDTTDLDVTAVRQAYEKSSAEKSTEAYVKKNKKNKGRTAIIVLLIIAAVATGGFAWYRSWAVLPEIGVDETPEPVETAAPSIAPVIESEEPVEPTPTPTPEPILNISNADQREGTYTFLCVGIDQVSTSTDTIMAVTFDVENHTVDVVSIPRDTLVNVGWGTKRINTIFSANQNDINAMIEGVEKLLGYPINCHVFIDIEAFVVLVDTLGGVTYNVPHDMYHYDPTQNLLIDIKAGEQHLTGEQAIQVVRYRDNVTADIGRIDTQQDFLLTAAKQVLQIENVTKINEFASIFEEYVDTNLTLGNIVRFGEEFLKVEPEDINFHVMPWSPELIRGNSYVEIVVDDWLTMVNENLNPLEEDIKRENMDVLTWDGVYATSTSGAIYGIESFSMNPSYVE